MIDDKDLIDYIRAHPSRTFADICEGVDVSCRRVRSDGGGYTNEAKALARQLQRSRRAGRSRTTQGQRWEVTEQ